jgi:hypothetical protein
MTRTRKQVGRYSKEKGKVYERHVCDVFNEWAGEKAFSRHWSGRNEAPELGDVLRPSWFEPTIECRKREGWSMEAALNDTWVVRRWYAELKEKARLHLMLLVFSRNGQPDFLMYGADESRWMAETVEMRMPPRVLMAVPEERSLALRICLLKDWLACTEPRELGRDV